MLHIATVHWRTEDWIDIQLAHLRRHIPGPYRVYAFLNEVPEANRAKFFHSSQEPVREHAVKLNMLADVICSNAAESDLIMFLDGDAFPIADLSPILDGKLAAHPLVAVQRLENNGDRQPHPCFCVTTVGFWNSIGGDWNEGYTWADKSGKPVFTLTANDFTVTDNGVEQKISLEDDTDSQPLALVVALETGSGGARQLDTDARPTEALDRLAV